MEKNGIWIATKLLMQMENCNKETKVGIKLRFWERERSCRLAVIVGQGGLVAVGGWGWSMDWERKTAKIITKKNVHCVLSWL